MMGLEEAVLKTLAYSAVFDFPLTISEIEQYLMGHRLEDPAELQFLFHDHDLPITEHQGCFWLSSANLNPMGLEWAWQRRKREQRAQKLLQEARGFLNQYLRWIPTLQMMAVTGSTAALNADRDADIDLLVVTADGTHWLTRALVLSTLELKNERVDLGKSTEANAGKFCLNMILEESEMEQEHQDLYTANEIARMKPVLACQHTYERFLEANRWVWDYLPNWQPTTSTNLPANEKLKYPKILIGQLENMTRRYQQRNHEKWAQTKTDHREKILAAYEDQLERLGL